MRKNDQTHGVILLHRHHTAVSQELSAAELAKYLDVPVAQVYKRGVPASDAYHALTVLRRTPVTDILKWTAPKGFRGKYTYQRVVWCLDPELETETETEPTPEEAPMTDNIPPHVLFDTATKVIKARNRAQQILDDLSDIDIITSAPMVVDLPFNDPSRAEVVRQRFMERADLENRKPTLIFSLGEVVARDPLIIQAQEGTVTEVVRECVIEKEVLVEVAPSWMPELKDELLNLASQLSDACSPTVARHFNKVAALTELGFDIRPAPGVEKGSDVETPDEGLVLSPLHGKRILVLDTKVSRNAHRKATGEHGARRFDWPHLADMANSTRRDLLAKVSRGTYDIVVYAQGRAARLGADVSKEAKGTDVRAIALSGSISVQRIAEALNKQ